MANEAHLSSKVSSRPLPKFPPTLWGTCFASLQSSHLEFESLTKDVEALRDKVKDMLMQSTKHLTPNIEFIDLLCRLGVSYHFGVEIDEQLNQIFTNLPTLLIQHDYDLYTSALLFRILRQHGFNMSCDVFEKFKTEEGEFEKSLHKDCKGLLSLYEASFLGVRGEYVLEEALSFTRDSLINLAEYSNPTLQKHIKHALFLPFHYYENRVQAREYIALYEEHESRNETLLKFAKVDYNRLQVLYQEELALLSRWWKELNLVEHYSFVRDRIVESYYWAVGMQFEPEYSLSRIYMAKYTAIATVVDDIYDSYATLDELQPLTSAIQRGRIEAIDELPAYMKVIYKAVLDLHDESENSGRNNFVKEAFKKMVKCGLVEKEWCVDSYYPRMDEYLQVKSITTTSPLYPAASFIGMENMLDTHQYQWLQKNSKMEANVALLFRMRDDLQDDEYDELSCIKCYSKEQGVSREKAIEEINKMVDEKWKDINEEYIKYKRVSKIFVNFFINQTRTVWFLFKFGDSFTNPQNMKHFIAPLFLDKFLV